MRLPISVLGLLLCCAAAAAKVTGRVVAVADGDTLTILGTSKQQHKFRLAFIDAPEKNQPYGQRSKQSPSDLDFGKEATAHRHKHDR